jgi:hypothetical protein
MQINEKHAFQKCNNIVMRNHIKTQYEWFLAILTNTDHNLLIYHITPENCKKSGQIHNWAIEGVDVSNMINMQRGDNFDVQLILTLTRKYLIIISYRHNGMER